LADTYPSHLTPQSGTYEGALKRARIAFFVDAWFSKFHNGLHRIYSAKEGGEQDGAVEEAVRGLVKEVEPLLKDAGPYFGGSGKLTMAEVSILLGMLAWLFLSIPGSVVGGLQSPDGHRGRC
jgi:glutathione S-transferase